METCQHLSLFWYEWYTLALSPRAYFTPFWTMRVFLKPWTCFFVIVIVFQWGHEDPRRLEARRLPHLHACRNWIWKFISIIQLQSLFSEVLMSHSGIHQKTCSPWTFWVGFCPFSSQSKFAVILDCKQYMTSLVLGVRLLQSLYYWYKLSYWIPTIIYNTTGIRNLYTWSNVPVVIFSKLKLYVWNKR